MGRYFSAQYDGAPFVLFGQAHLWTVFALGLVFWLLLRWGRDTTADNRRAFRRGLAVFVIALDLLGHWFWWNGGVWSAQSLLPLHMCSAMTYVMAWALLTDSRRLYPLVYFLGIGGAIQAIITPDAAEYGFPHFRYWDAMLSHGALVLGGLWVIVAEGVRPTRRDLLETFAGLNAYALVIFFVNKLLGSNYLYVNGKPDVATAMDFMPDWPYYILVLEALALGLFLLMYLPFWWREQYGTAASPDVSVA